MRTVKEIRLTVTYTVSLLNADMSDEVFNQLDCAFSMGDELEADHAAYSKAMDWINSHVKESDCLDWKAEIDSLDY